MTVPISLVFCVRFSPSGSLFLLPKYNIAFDTRILHLAYFWLLIIATSVDTITLGLFCVKVYLAWKDSITTPILSALLTQ